MRLLVAAFILTALAAVGTAYPATAQEPASIRFVVRDSSATPQPGLTIVLDAGDGRGALPRVTDDQGATERIISATRLVTVTQVLDRDGTALTFEMTTLDGLLVLPLQGDLEIPWSYDRESRSVISLPRTMTNEAFPELEPVSAGADGQIDLAATPLPTSTVVGVPPDVGVTALPGEAEAGGNSLFWLIVGGLILIGISLGLFVWANARAAAARRRPTQRRGGPKR